MPLSLKIFAISCCDLPVLLANAFWISSRFPPACFSTHACHSSVPVSSFFSPRPNRIMKRSIMSRAIHSVRSSSSGSRVSPIS